MGVHTARVVARGKRFVWLRIPSVHPTRVLTLPAMTIPESVAVGEEISVEVRSPIESASSGWTAFVVPVEGGGA